MIRNLFRGGKGLLSLKDGFSKDLSSLSRLRRRTDSHSIQESLLKQYASKIIDIPDQGGGFKVVHNKRKEYFYIDAPDCRPVLEYEKKGKTVTILNTDVPEKCAGKGYGTMLAEVAVNWVAENRYDLRVECDFVEQYMKKYRSDFKKFPK